MADAKPRDTIKFEPVERELGVDKRVEYTLDGRFRLSARARGELTHPIELRLGECSPPLLLIPNPSFGGEDLRKYMLLQPDVLRHDLNRGCIEFESLAKLGRGISPDLDLGPDVSRHHCIISESVYPPDEDFDAIEIENFGRNGMRVLVHPDDFLDIRETPDSSWGE